MDIDYEDDFGNDAFEEEDIQDDYDWASCQRGEGNHKMEVI